MSRTIKVLCYLAPWFAVIFMCSYFTPYFGNDYRYMLVEGTDSMVGSLYDILVSQYRHYFDWGGRTVNHLLAQFLLYIGKPWQSLITAAGYILLVLAICWTGFGYRPSLRLRLLPLCFVSLILWLCLRNFGEVVINVVSSCNYMFSTLIILLFLLPFRQSMHKERDVRPGWFAAVMFGAGLIAGWTNENTGFAAVAVVGLYNLKLLCERRLSLWQLCAGCGLLLGYLLLILAPGNEARLEFMQAKGFDFWQHFFDASLSIIGISFVTQHLLLISLIYVLWLLNRHALLRLSSPDVCAGLWLCAAGFLSLLIMLASPTIPARSVTPFTVFTAAGVLALYRELYLRGIKVLPAWSLKLLLPLFFAFSAATAFNAVQGYYQAHLDNYKRGLEIILQLRQGKKDLVVHPLNVSRTRYLYLADAKADKNNWANLILARYYGLDSIVRICDEPQSDRIGDFVYFSKLGQPICRVKKSSAAGASGNSSAIEQ